MRSGLPPARRAAASLLDRLLDARPDQAQDRPQSAAQTVADVRASVQRDLEALLNARRPWRSVETAWPALRTSPAGYGLVDFTGGAFNDPDEREALRAGIEAAIARFEPRLTEVEVHLDEQALPLSATLALRIDALLLLHPQPQPISFDTTVEASTADVILRSAKDV